jgi:hypothetical protein
MTDRPADEDKRQSERLRILGALHGEVMVFQPLAVREISRDGAQVEAGFPLLLDSLHDFRLTLGDRSIVLKGRIAHCSISDVDQDVVLYCAGVQFVELSDRVEAAINEFIEALKAGRNISGASSPQ